MNRLAITPELSELLCSPSTAVAISISGGKDSAALALSAAEHLRAFRFKGEVILIHSDLGEIEWRESIEVCRRLA